jgi:hypothetical protein
MTKANSNIKAKLLKMERRRKEKWSMKEEIKKIKVIRRKNLLKIRKENDCFLCHVASSLMKIDQLNRTAKGGHVDTHRQQI